MTTNHGTIGMLDLGSARARLQLSSLEASHPRADRAAAMRARGRREGFRGTGDNGGRPLTLVETARVADLRRVFAIEALAKVKGIIRDSSQATVAPRGVIEAQARYGDDFPGPQPFGHNVQTPGQSQATRVRVGIYDSAPMALRSSVFGGSGLGGIGLGNGCTSTGANIAQATIAAGGAVATSFSSGDLASTISQTSTTSISSKTGLPMATSPTTTTTLTAGQKAALASSVILNLTSSIYGAVCTARGSTEATTVGSVSTAATTSAIALVTAARAGTTATPAPGTVVAPTATTAPTTTATGTTPGAAPAVTADNKTMLYVGGAIAGVAILGLLVLRK